MFCMSIPIRMTIPIRVSIGRHSFSRLSLAQISSDEKLDEEEEVRSEQPASEERSVFRSGAILCGGEEWVARM